MNLTQQLKNQKEQNAKIVGENFKLNQKVERLEFELKDFNFKLENERRVVKSLSEHKSKLQGEIIGLEKVIRILTNKEKLPF
jgi:predicted nuclease with TOPRIM domain